MQNYKKKVIISGSATIILYVKIVNIQFNIQFVTIIVVLGALIRGLKWAFRRPAVAMGTVVMVAGAPFAPAN